MRRNTPARLGNKLRKLRSAGTYLRGEVPLWAIGLLTDWMPDNPVTCRLRGTLARPFLGSAGRNLQFGTRVRFLNPQGIHLGDDVYVASGCWLSGSGGLEVGDEVMFGPYCVVVTSNHRFEGGSVRFAGGSPAPVSIGRGSWLGAHVVVSAGASVGEGSLVGANSVVIRDVPDRVLAGGVPAKVIRPQPEAPTPDGADEVAPS